MTARSDAVVSLAEHRDAPHLKALWKSVFCDDETDIDHFFSTYFLPEHTVVIRDGLTPVSAAYVLPVGHLVLPDAAPIACAMIYAIATLPEFRGRGYGQSVTLAAAELAQQKGFPAVVLKPADDGLFTYYEEHSAFRSFFSVFETSFSAATLMPNRQKYPIDIVSSADYRRLRRTLLAGTTYIDTDERALSYQQYLCRATSGALCALSSDDRYIGCAIVERGNGNVRVKELLIDRDRWLIDAVSAIAAEFPAEEYSVRHLFPDVTNGHGNRHRFGMMIPVSDVPGQLSASAAHWFGPAFD